MFRNANKDFKDKLSKRIDILLSRKRCNECFNTFGNLIFPLEKITKTLKFSNKKNFYLFTFDRRVPIIEKHIFQDNFIVKKLKQNKPSHSEFYKNIKFLIICSKCQSGFHIYTPKNFFG